MATLQEQIARMYATDLGRTASQEEIDYWASNPGGFQGARQGILGSDEYKGRYANNTTDRFITTSRADGREGTQLSNNPNFVETLDPVTLGRLYYTGTKGQDASVSGPYAWVPQYNQLEQDKNDLQTQYDEAKANLDNFYGMDPGFVGGWNDFQAGGGTWEDFLAQQGSGIGGGVMPGGNTDDKTKPGNGAGNKEDLFGSENSKDGRSALKKGNAGVF